MGNIVPFNNADLPAELQDVFNPEEMVGDLFEGVSGGFAVISFRGGKWRIKSGGEEKPVVDGEGEPVASLPVVILKGSKHVSKIFYVKDYEEGDDAEPDCFSIDGERPDSSSPNPQCKTCAACPNNVWGSKISPAGKKTKKCGDSRRLAVVPLGDIPNEADGGPMLLRVPAASLADLAKYGKGMAAKGYPYNIIGTKVGFDLEASYPKLTFKPVRALTRDEQFQVAEHFKGDTLNAILDASPAVAAPAAEAPAKPAAKKPEPAVSLDFEEEPAQQEEAPEVKATAKKASAKKAAAAKKAEAKPKEAPAAAEASAEDDLADILSDLENLE